MPNRPRRKLRRRSRDSYPGSMISRYMRSPYDPDNSRNFWGYIVSRTIASPPRSGAGRWLAWLLALTFVSIAVFGIVFGDGVTVVVGIVFGIAGVVVLLRRIGGSSR